MGYRYSKRSQLKYTKQRYRVRNWPEYEAGLRKWGDLTLWFSEEAIAAWRAPTSEKPGEQLFHRHHARLDEQRNVQDARPPRPDPLTRILRQGGHRLRRRYLNA